MVEQGFKDFVMMSWHGVWAPAGLPANVQRTLVSAISKFMSDPRMRERISNEGLEPVVSTQEEFIEFEKREHAFYKRLVTEGIVKPVKQ
jgi:tripartite-type tricarboxylate transporter receptor subunit TctC